MGVVFPAVGIGFKSTSGEVHEIMAGNIFPTFGCEKVTRELRQVDETDIKLFRHLFHRIRILSMHARELHSRRDEDILCTPAQ